MSVHWLMEKREELLWAGRLAADDWSWTVWKSLFFSGGLIALWLLFLFFTVVGVIPRLRRWWCGITGLSISPGHGLASFLCSALTFSLTHSVIFSVGVIAYWLNSVIPAYTMESLSEFSFKWLSVVGWFFGG